jgi:hypothetical protein
VELPGFDGGDGGGKAAAEFFQPRQGKLTGDTVTARMWTNAEVSVGVLKRSSGRESALTQKVRGKE